MSTLWTDVWKMWKRTEKDPILGGIRTFRVQFMGRRVENVETDRERPFIGPDKDALGPDYE